MKGLGQIFQGRTISGIVLEFIHAFCVVLDRRCGKACVPIAMVLGLVFWFFVCSLFQNRQKKVLSKAQNPLQALLTILTPTHSAWPLSYSALVQRVSTSGSNTITISLAQLLGDVYLGTLELRDPTNDLPDLFRGGIKAYGWWIRLNVGTSYRIAVLRWLSSSAIPMYKVIIDIFRHDHINSLFPAACEISYR
jgi:hypothetical protein